MGTVVFACVEVAYLQAQNISGFEQDAGPFVQELAVPHKPPTDTDGDGLADTFEINILHTDPNNPDSDGDGTPDGVELQNGTDPLDPTSGAAASPPPSVPAGVQIVSRSQSELTLAWQSSQPAPNRTVARYEIFLNGNKITDTTALEITIPYDSSKLLLCFYSVRAMDNAGTYSGFSLEVLVKPIELADVMNYDVEFKRYSAQVGIMGISGFKSSGKTYLTQAYSRDISEAGTLWNDGPVGEISFRDTLSITKQYDYASGLWLYAVGGEYVSVGYPDRPASAEWKLDATGTRAILQPAWSAVGQGIDLTNSSIYQIVDPEATDTSASRTIQAHGFSGVPWDSSLGQYYTRTESYLAELSDELTADVNGQLVTGAIAQVRGEAEGQNWDTVTFVETQTGIGQMFTYQGAQDPERGWYLATYYADSSQTRVEGSFYRLVSTNPGPVRLRWAELFNPQASQSPPQVKFREAILGGGPDNVVPDAYHAAPPETNGEIRLEPLAASLELLTPSLTADMGEPRLYLPDALFNGQAAEVKARTQNPYATTAAVVSLSGDVTSVKLVAVDPAVLAQQGLLTAISQGVEIPNGTDLWAHPHRPGVGEDWDSWILMAVALAPGTVEIKITMTTLGQDVVTSKVLTIFHPFEIAVDANRDGEIKFASEDDSDMTADVSPYRFWINDDNDGYALNDEQEITGEAAKDYESRGDFGIASKRDLEDFSRMWLSAKGITTGLKSGALQLGFKWADGHRGSPKINLYPHYESDGGTNYITDSTAASGQITYPWSATMISTNNKDVIAPGEIFILKKDYFSNLSEEQPVAHFLFEGAGVGAGQLIWFLLDQNGNEVGTGAGVWFDLMQIKSMYQQFRATPNTLPRPFDSLFAPYNSDQVGFEVYPGRPAFQPASDEEQKVLVFVNGSNESYAYSTSVAETLFKRLWWQGYKGRLVSFRWETLVGPFFGEIPAHYNLNEWLAWNWGKGLRDLVESAHIPNGYTVIVAAHSLGCTVVASALQLGMSATNVIMMQGAIPAGCVDASGGQSDPTSVNGYSRMWERESDIQTPDFAGVLGYRGFVSNSGGATIYNFYNTQDYALFSGLLNVWEGNQRINKPDPLNLFSDLSPGLSYQYNPVASLPAAERGRLFFEPTADKRFVITPYESMAFIARSRSKALGAKEGVGGIINFNVDIGPGSSTNLQDTRSDHSGQFSRSIQQLQGFYLILSDIIE